jgi:hypothetical protein
VGQHKIGARCAARRGKRDAAGEALLEQRSAGDMVGMHMRVQGKLQLQAQLLNHRPVAARLFEHRVDQHGFVGALVPQQIAVS